MDKLLFLISVKFFVLLCISAKVFPREIQSFIVGFILPLPSKKLTTIYFFFLISFIKFPFMSSIGLGQKKEFLLRYFITFTKNGISFSLTLFSKIVKIYFSLDVTSK